MKKLLFVVAVMAMMLGTGCKQTTQQVVETPWYENDSALQADLAAAIEDAKVLDSSKIVNDLMKFKTESDVILANRYDSEVLGDVEEKVYTRDLYRRD